MSYFEKDELFKSLYLDAIDKDLEENPVDYDFMDFTGLLFDNKLVLDVYSKEPQISEDDELDLLNYRGDIIGYFVFTDKPKVISDLSTCTADEILYIWSKYRKNGVLQERFLCDFLVIEKEYFNNYYENHYETSSLWGGYKHTEREFIEYKKTQELRLPESKIFFPTSINIFNSDMSVYSSNIYENFLKKYHQIELIFNLIFIKKLKSIDLESLKDIHSIYKSMNKSEFDAIFYIISSYITNKVKYLKIFEIAYFNHQDIYNEIFHNYEKDSNPLSDSILRDKFHLFLTKATQSNPLSAEDYFDIAKEKEIKFKIKYDDFSNFIYKFLSYTIYRIRCSIAHNKLGEFMFTMDQDHLDFMVDVGLPLIRETVIDVFSNQSFKEIFEQD
ncbi:MAG: hypothetical protein RR904_06275 [Bacilli bacterium]